MVELLNDTPRAQSRRHVPDNSDGIDWSSAMERADAQRVLSPELVITPVGSSGDTSGVRGAHSAINWAVRAHEFEEHQRSRGIRAERLAMGALGSTPENRVPTVMAQPVVEQASHEREHLQSLRNMRDQTQALASDLSSVSVQMAADVEQSGVELRDSQERFEADRQRFRGETPEGQQHQSSASHHHHSRQMHHPGSGHLKENEASRSRRPHVVSETEPMMRDATSVMRHMR